MKKDIILVAMVATKMIWVYNNALLRKELGELIMKTTTQSNTFSNEATEIFKHDTLSGLPWVILEIMERAFLVLS